MSAATPRIGGAAHSLRSVESAAGDPPTLQRGRGDMARGTLGIIAIIILIALVVYFVMEDRDNELEIDVGSREVPVSVLGAVAR
jgi:hypothetical protein